MTDKQIAEMNASTSRTNNCFDKLFEGEKLIISIRIKHFIHWPNTM